MTLITMAGDSFHLGISRQVSLQYAAVPMSFPDRVQQLLDALLGTPGSSDTNLRRTVFDRTRTGTWGEEPDSGLRDLVEKIDRQPWSVSDDDLAQLFGHSEDWLFEMTLAAATGAGVRRLEAGMRAIEAAGAGSHTSAREER